MDVINRHGWVVSALAVGLCALLLGRAGSSALQLGLLSAIPIPDAPFSTVRAAAEFPKAGGSIATRNVFCSTCPPPVIDSGPARASEMEPRRTTLPIQLLAVNHVMPASGGGYATVVLRDTESRSVGGFASGDTVKGAIITGIDETRVHLDNGGVPEFLDLLDSEVVVKPVSSVAPARVQDDPVSQELARGIKKLGDHRYELSRAALESVLGNMNLLARSARIMPEVKEGKAAGFRFTNVRPGGPFALIGLQEGDVISAINGMELTSPEKAFDVYARLKSASHLTLGLERGGRRISNEYAIR